jgi:hypothetical protein
MDADGRGRHRILGGNERDVAPDWQPIPADLAVSLGVPAAAPVGSPFAVTFALANRGRGPAIGVTVDLAPSPGLAVAAAQLGGVPCTIEATVRCTLARLAPAQEVAGQVDLVAAAPGPAAVTAAATALGADARPGDNATQVELAPA